MKKFVQIFLIVITIISCSSKNEFNAKKWQQKDTDWSTTDVREKIVDDLIQSDTLIGLNKNEVIELLGQPEKNENLEMQYLVREKYGYNIDPEYISMLNIQFGENQKVIKYSLIQM